MSSADNLYFFKCSVSDDLYGASPNKNGSPLPTPGGGAWLLLPGIESLESARSGFVELEAKEEIGRWDCHWFTSEGSTDIYWGPDGPPSN